MLKSLLHIEGIKTAVDSACLKVVVLAEGDSCCEPRLGTAIELAVGSATIVSLDEFTAPLESIMPVVLEANVYSQAVSTDMFAFIVARVAFWKSV